MAEISWTKKTKIIEILILTVCMAIEKFKINIIFTPSLYSIHEEH